MEQFLESLNSSASDTESEHSEDTESVYQTQNSDTSSCGSCWTVNDVDMEQFPGILESPHFEDGERLKAEGIPKLTEMVWASDNPILRPYTVIQRIYLGWDAEPLIQLPPISPKRTVSESLPILDS